MHSLNKKKSYEPSCPTRRHSARVDTAQCQLLFKVSGPTADDTSMSEPANETMDAPILPPPSGDAPADLPAPAPTPLPLTDVEMPRLAQTSVATPHRRDVEPPVITPPLSGTDLPTLPPSAPQESPAASVPTSTAQTDASTADTGDTSPTAPTEPEGDVEGQQHPMAHLMMTKAPATEASKRAAAIRAQQKAKARKVKIGIVIGFLIVAVTVGPLVGKWVIDGVNDVGNTSTDEP